MEQKRHKNFIAFTLSEMMIVLLIISILSAVTLPNIVGRKSTKNVSSSSTWQYDYVFTYGNYYKGNTDNTQVVIGLDLGSSDANIIPGSAITVREAYANAFGDSALLLKRKNILPFATMGRADIAFFDGNNNPKGTIAADSYGNMIVGKSVGNLSTLEQAQNSYGNLFVGLNLGSNTPINTYGNVNNNTVLGVNTLQGSYLDEKNIVIGNNISRVNLQNNNIVIGNYAAYASLYSTSNPAQAYSSTVRYNNTIAIGKSASSNTNYSNACINIGRLAGAYGTQNYGSPLWKLKYIQNNNINIGSYASYNTYASFYASNSDINIGWYAGARDYYRKRNDVINLGNFAGYQNYRGINIGSYAGYNDTIVSQSSSSYPPYGQYSINIGRYSMTKDSYAINIGGRANYIKKSGSNIDIGYNTGSIYDYSLHSSLRSYGGAVFIGDYTGDVNIGAYAGYGITSGVSNVFIGLYSGYFPYANFVSSPVGNIILGSYATTYGNDSKRYARTDTGSGNIIIGCSGAKITGMNKMCIGGKYPLGPDQRLTDITDSNIPAWDPHAANGNTTIAPYPLNGYYDYEIEDRNRNNWYETFITTPGILAASNVAWSKTRIMLYSKYLIATQATMKRWSDKTLKENIQNTKYGIEKLRKIAVKEFNMKGSNIPNIGVIAQELMKIYPHAVTEVMNPQDGKNYYTVSPDWIIFSMVQALKDVDAAALDLYKELSDNKTILAKETKKVELLETRLDKLSSSNKVLQSQLSEIDKMLK